MKDTWYTDKDVKHAAGVAFEYAKELDDARENILKNASENLQLYDGRGVLTGNRLSPLKPPADYTSENGLKSVVDTAMSLVARNNPRVVFMTDGGDFSEQMRARGMERFLEGLFEAEGVAIKRRLAVRDGFLTGTGFVRVTPDRKRNRPRFDRIPIDEVLVDEWAARNGNARELLHQTFVDRHALAALFKDKDIIEAIMRASPPDELASEATEKHPASESIIKVIEAYRLPSAPGEGDGKLRTFINGRMIRDEQWTRDEFPFVRYCWTEATLGWYGSSLAEEIAGMQIRIHQENIHFDESMDRLAHPRIYVHQSDVESVKTSFVKGIGHFVSYKMQPPVVENPRVLSPDMVQMHERRFEKMFRLTGVGEMAAFAKKPADIRSAPGLREFNDTQSERFVINIMDAEQMTLELGRHAIEVARQMYVGKGGDPEVYWKSRDAAKRIKWSEVELPRDSYCLSIQAASTLARSPAGRKDMVMDLFGAGLLPPEKALKLLDIPDLEKENDLAMAEERDIDATIEKLEDGKEVAFDPYQNPDMAFMRIRQNYLRIKHLENCPDEVIQAHLRYLDQVDGFLKKRQEAEMQQQMAMMQQQMAAQGAPMAPEEPELSLEEQVLQNSGI